MTKYKIAIEERLVRLVEVEADSVAEAEDKVEAMWLNEEIVLSANDFAGAGLACVSDVAGTWRDIM